MIKAFQSVFRHCMARRQPVWRRIGWCALYGSSALTIASCASDAVAPSDPGVAPPALVLASPAVVRVADGLRVVPDTLVLQLRDANGDPLRNEKVDAAGTTGWLRELPSGDWARPNTMNTDSLGRLHLLWLPSAGGTQKLSFGAMGTAALVQTFALARTGVPFLADSVVTSGSDAICFQRGGRIGCVGTGVCGDCGPGAPPYLALDSVHWFRLTAPPLRLTSTLSGACALLTDGNTSCWNGVGPDSIARNDVGHPPFVEFTGSIGRTADGAVWKGVISGPSGYPHRFSYRTWNRIPSDSVMASLLADFDESFVCARTAGNAVMCSFADRGLLEPSVIMQPFRPLRSAADSSVMHAVAGYTAVSYEPGMAYPSVVIRTAAGTSLRFINPSRTSSGWYGTPLPDSTLSGIDVRLRSCVAELSTCDPGRPWHDVSITGRMTSSGPYASREYGYRRTCGVRAVIVCHLLIKSAAGQGRFAYRFESVDTVKVAP
jgi:hypothetical protein